MANYPSTQNTDDNLYTGVNNLSTVLTDNPLTAGAVTVNVSDASGFPTVGILTIDLEAIHYTGTTATSFTGCTRGFDGTTGASHPVSTTVFHDIPAAHHNVLKDEIKAVSDDLRDGFTVDLDDSVAPAATATDNKQRLDHIVTAIKNATGEADWKTVPAETLSSLETAKAEDSEVVHDTGAESIAGIKTFTDNPVISDATEPTVDLNETDNTITVRSRATNTGTGSFIGTDTNHDYSIRANSATGILLDASDGSAAVLTGTTAGGSAAAGIVGEHMEAKSSTNANFPTTDTYGDANSLSLTAGDWDLSYQLVAIRNTGTWTRVDMGVGTVTGDDITGAIVTDNFIITEFPSTSSNPQTLTPVVTNFQVSISSTTTYFAKVKAVYSAGQPQYTYRFSARRVR